jgi:hypothetical protein
MTLEYTTEYALKHAIEQFAMRKDDVKEFCNTNNSDYSPYEFYLYEQDNKTSFICSNSIFNIGKKIVGYVHFFYVNATDTFCFAYATDCVNCVEKNTLEDYMKECFHNSNSKIIAYPYK